MNVPTIKIVTAFSGVAMSAGAAALIALMVDLVAMQIEREQMVAVDLRPVVAEVNHRADVRVAAVDRVAAGLARAARTAVVARRAKPDTKKAAAPFAGATAIFNVSGGQRSMHIATPMPPPMQSVARPFLASRRFISCSRVTSTRAPEAPIG